MVKPKQTPKLKDKNITSVKLKEEGEETPINYKTRLQRAQSSRPLRISLKDLE